MRQGLMHGEPDPSCLDYTTGLELFGSGTVATDHGMADMEKPSGDAVAIIHKMDRRRGITPVSENTTE